MEVVIAERTFIEREFSSLHAENPDLFKWCVSLVQENMEFRHSKSLHLPWCKKKKTEELGDELTRVIVIQDAFNLKPAAFASYQITSEPDLNDRPVPCLYWYELQVSKDYRGLGVGGYLVGRVQRIAKMNADKCHKIMLTAFKPLPNNRIYKSPIAFYSKHGFKADPISPSQCLKAKEAAGYDYEIMSKSVSDL